jgi:hypothetical protein
MQRRTLFKLGIASATVLVLAGGAAALIEPGLTGGRLSASGREVFSAVGRAVLDKSIPADEGARQIALNGLLTRIDTLVAGLPPHAQAELSQLLSLLATAGGRRALAGLNQPWADASVTEIQQALQGMRLSSLALRQQAYGALHDITAGAYFADDATWSLVGYPGPLKI